MIPIIIPNLMSRIAGRSLLLAPIIGCALACISCQDPSQPIVDVSPLGDGLKVIGYAFVGAAVLGVLGKLVK